MKHELKVRQEFFQAIWCGDKTFEIRKKDRDFQERHEVVLQEYDEAADDYTGREVEGFITYLSTFEQQPGYCVFSFRVTRQTE